LGHAKAITFNFGVARKRGGRCNLRFDDTNPDAEKTEYIDSIIDNVKWLGHTPDNIFFSSDYFPRKSAQEREKRKKLRLILWIIRAV